MALSNMLISTTLIIIAFAGGLALFSKAGDAPGLNNDQLTDCPSKPNCVCSENDRSLEHYIAPMPLLPEQQQQAMPAVKASIIALGGQIQEEKPHYLASTFSSKFLGFIDDLEIRIDTEQNQIHLRSSSRIGYSDFGVNRKRAASLKSTIQHHLDTMTGKPE